MVDYKRASVKVGKQVDGGSAESCKEMAIRAITSKFPHGDFGIVADVGGGAGGFAKRIVEEAEHVFLLDYSPPDTSTLPHGIDAVQVDLNHEWKLEDGSVDLAVAIEVIEHVENPRHFFREISRIVRPGGFVFVSTPNNHSLFSKLTFLLFGIHRGFQNLCYPAHISPLMEIDFRRLASEHSLNFDSIYWSGTDTIPKLHWRLTIGGRFFSHSIGVLLQKPRESAES